ncbi:MAG: helix-turn-helix transcriptional regulator [Armatimonadota bacterium]|nr:helix-turn-helix transcriptional regulator [Armatimonadota bacterium]
MAAEEGTAGGASDRSDSARAMGQRIAQARREAGYRTAQDFSEDLDVSVWTVRSWESGKSQPRYDMLQTLSELTGRSKAWFLGEGGVFDSLDRAVSELLSRSQARRERAEEEEPEAGVYGIPTYDEAAEEELQALSAFAREEGVLIRLTEALAPAGADEVAALHLALANLVSGTD